MAFEVKLAHCVKTWETWSSIQVHTFWSQLEPSQEKDCTPSGSPHSEHRKSKSIGVLSLCRWDTWTGWQRTEPAWFAELPSAEKWWVVFEGEGAAIEPLGYKRILGVVTPTKPELECILVTSDVVWQSISIGLSSYLEAPKLSEKLDVTLHPHHCPNRWHQDQFPH